MHHLAPLSIARVLRRAALMCVGLAALGASAAPDTSAGKRLASEQGCLNCHLAHDGSAPSLQRLTSRLERHGDQPAALQHVIDELRGQRSIHGHQLPSDEALLGVLRWMAQGAR